MAISHFYDLPHRVRLRIVNGTRAELANLGWSGSHSAADAELEDVVRCAIDTYWDVAGQDEVHEAFDRGVAEGDAVDRAVAHG